MAPYCTVEIMVIDAAEIDQSWSTSTLPQRCSMSTLDEIAKEKQRVSEALARIDAQREKTFWPAQRTVGRRALARALQHRHAGEKDHLARDADHGGTRGRSSTIG